MYPVFVCEPRKINSKRRCSFILVPFECSQGHAEPPSLFFAFLGSVISWSVVFSALGRWASDTLPLACLGMPIFRAGARTRFGVDFLESLSSPKQFHLVFAPAVTKIDENRNEARNGCANVCCICNKMFGFCMYVEVPFQLFWCFGAFFPAGTAFLLVLLPGTPLEDPSVHYRSCGGFI